MEKMRILAVRLAYGHDTTIPDSFRSIKCYRNFARDVWLQAILIYSSGSVDASKIHEGMSVEDCPIDVSKLTKLARDCDSVGNYLSELKVTVHSKITGETRVVSVLCRSGTAMGQTEEDFQMEEAMADEGDEGVEPKRKKRKSKPSGNSKPGKKRRGNSIGKRSATHYGSKGHKHERIACTLSGRYMLAPADNAELPPSVEEARNALFRNMLRLSDDEEIVSVELEDKVAFSLSEEGIRNGVSAAIFSRSCVDDSPEQDGIESRAKRRSFMGFVVERAVSLLISPRFHFNRTNLSFELYRWGRAATDCSAAWIEKMEWRLSNLESLSRQMRLTIRRTVKLVKSSNGDLTRYQSLRDEGGRSLQSGCYAIQTTELMHLFLSASVNSSGRAKSMNYAKIESHQTRLEELKDAKYGNRMVKSSEDRSLYNWAAKLIRGEFEDKCKHSDFASIKAEVMAINEADPKSEAAGAGAKRKKRQKKNKPATEAEDRKQPDVILHVIVPRSDPAKPLSSFDLKLNKLNNVEFSDHRTVLTEDWSPSQGSAHGFAAWPPQEERCGRFSEWAQSAEKVLLPFSDVVSLIRATTPGQALKLDVLRRKEKRLTIETLKEWETGFEAQDQEQMQQEGENGGRPSVTIGAKARAPAVRENEQRDEAKAAAEAAKPGCNQAGIMSMTNPKMAMANAPHYMAMMNSMAMMAMANPQYMAMMSQQMQAAGAAASSAALPAKAEGGGEHVKKRRQAKMQTGEETERAKLRRERLEAEDREAKAAPPGKYYRTVIEMKNGERVIYRKLVDVP